MQQEYKAFHPNTRSRWRARLEKNYQTSPGVWFMCYKKESGKPGVSYDEAVEEALCFGRIDSLQCTLENERTMLKIFTNA
jgi:uncharacterized protein YdeI (YjbR/CyaY-like superfamily)